MGNGVELKAVTRWCLRPRLGCSKTERGLRSGVNPVGSREVSTITVPRWLMVTEIYAIIEAH
jgi:hypothetical protein